MMKRLFISIALCALSWGAWAVDMQAHMGTREAREAYSQYLEKQTAYYTDTYSPDALRTLSGDDLFGALNTLMGSTCRIAETRFSYNNLRSQYKYVDKDLNQSGYIIGYYDGCSMNGTWDSGSTWNREHTWPQSKGADKSIPMGYDMQSVRPASTAVNSDRGNTPYGESSSYYDPNVVSINNALYVSTNLGSYRGDAARVVLYDYIVYGQAGSYKSSLYNGNAQLLGKLGKSGVFESIPVLLKWHMTDPVSLTEMVRNDGAANYQGNRNPFIDYPELAIQMLKNVSGVTTYTVSTTGATLWPAYALTLKDGFIAYLGTPDNRPTEVTVTGATGKYDKESGRLTITNVTGAVSITAVGAEALEQTADGKRAIKTIYNGQVIIIKNGKAYTTLGTIVGDLR